MYKKKYFIYMTSFSCIISLHEQTYDKELIELLFEHSYCKNEYLVDRLKISRITASKYQKELESLGNVISKQIWKEMLYINTELFDLLKK